QPPPSIGRCRSDVLGLASCSLSCFHAQQLPTPSTQHRFATHSGRQAAGFVSLSRGSSGGACARFSVAVSMPLVLPPAVSLFQRNFVENGHGSQQGNTLSGKVACLFLRKLLINNHLCLMKLSTLRSKVLPWCPGA